MQKVTVTLNLTRYYDPIRHPTPFSGRAHVSNACFENSGSWFQFGFFLVVFLGQWAEGWNRNTLDWHHGRPVPGSEIKREVQLYLYKYAQWVYTHPSILRTVNPVNSCASHMSEAQQPCLWTAVLLINNLHCYSHVAIFGNKKMDHFKIIFLVENLWNVVHVIQ